MRLSICLNAIRNSGKRSPHIRGLGLQPHPNLVFREKHQRTGSIIPQPSSLLKNDLLDRRSGILPR